METCVKDRGKVNECMNVLGEDGYKVRAQNAAKLSHERSVSDADIV